MAKQATSSARRHVRSDVLGVTSDGVKILRPVRGVRNLSDRQVRQIVDGMWEIIRKRREQLPESQ